MKNSCLIALLFVFATGFSRDEQAWKSEKTIAKQYEVMKGNLKFYGGYYLLTEHQLNEYQKAVSDSLAKLKTEIVVDLSKIAEEEGQIKRLEADLKSTKEQLQASIENENSILSFWGYTSKTTFSAVMYTIVFVLIGLAVFAFLLFVRGNKVTEATVASFEELREEYESHKKRALEKEMKLNRELQTERNKNLSRTK